MVVTREEIQRCLWKDSTFVDFEHGINFSINQIRGALSDSAEKPRYVETVPRRGYRFIGTVEQPSPPKPDSTQETTVPPLEVRPMPAKTARRRWPVIVVLTVLAAAVVVGAYFFSHRAPLFEWPGHDCTGRLCQHDRRRCLRWRTSPGARCAIAAIALSERAFRCAHPADLATDGPAGGRQSHITGRAGRLRADGEYGGRQWFH